MNKAVGKWGAYRWGQGGYPPLCSPPPHPCHPHPCRPHPRCPPHRPCCPCPLISSSLSPHSSSSPCHPRPPVVLVPLPLVIFVPSSSPCCPLAVPSPSPCHPLEVIMGTRRSIGYCHGRVQPDMVSLRMSNIHSHQIRTYPVTQDAENQLQVTAVCTILWNPTFLRAWSRGCSHSQTKEIIGW